MLLVGIIFLRISQHGLSFHPVSPYFASIAFVFGLQLALQLALLTADGFWCMVYGFDVEFHNTAVEFPTRFFHGVAQGAISFMSSQIVFAVVFASLCLWGCASTPSFHSVVNCFFLASCTR